MCVHVCEARLEEGVPTLEWNWPMEGSVGGGEEEDMSHLLAQSGESVVTTSSLKSGWEGFFSNCRNGQRPVDQRERAAAADGS